MRVTTLVVLKQDIDNFRRKIRRNGIYPFCQHHPYYGLSLTDEYYHSKTTMEGLGFSPNKKPTPALEELGLEVDAETAQLCPLSDDFKTFFDYFKGKDARLFFRWLRTHEHLFNDTGQFLLHTIEINKLNPVLAPFPSDGLISLSLDMTDLSPHELKSLLNQINQSSLFSVTLTGESAFAADFIRGLSQVELIQISPDKAELHSLASQMSHRNQLRRLLSVSNEDDDNLFKQWSNLCSPDNWWQTKLYLIKPQDFQYQGIYTRALYPVPEEDKGYLPSYMGSERNITPAIQEDAQLSELFAAINACVVGMGDWFFQLFLKKSASSPPEHFAIVIDRHLNDFMLEELIRTPLPFKRITLFIDKATVANPRFRQLLLSFNQRQIEQLHLTLTDGDDAIDQELFSELNYLVAIRTQNATTIMGRHEGIFQSTSNLRNEENVIERVQELNYQRVLSYQSAPLEFKAIEGSATPAPLPAETKNVFAKKIAIKECIDDKTKLVEARKQHLQLELQHVDEQVLDRQVEQKHDHQRQTELVQSIEQKFELLEEKELKFDGDEETLVTLHRLRRKPYSSIANYSYDYNLPKPQQSYITKRSEIYEQIKHELFNHFPHALDAMTPRAAKAFSRSIQIFSTLNLKYEPSPSAKNSLPEHFFIIQRNGKRILDYDPYLITSNQSPFAPLKSTYQLAYSDETIGDVRYKSLRFYFPNDRLMQIFQDAYPHRDKPYHLEKLVLKYGDKGCRYFFEQLVNLTNQHPDFYEFIASNYLVYFTQFHFFMDDSDFFDALALINHLTRFA